ncbi:helix-turn-helix domain-containing protein [Rathayibacter sp. VKM Ac-2803]|nr:helix-turn-helix domain-containing protein [Rathayibacter sp. VKM Ac-2803]MWV60121.1 helix-turn-helix domain-containing protein [Rathayibacter sp. VKM Ac-2754]
MGPRIPALRKGIAILQVLSSSASPVPASVLSRRIETPRSTTYQLLQVLVDEGLVVHIPESQGYTLAVGVFELGSAYLRHHVLENIGRPVLKALATGLGHTAHMGVLHGHETLYLLKEQPLRPTTLVTAVGVRLPAQLTASGRTMLAQLSDAQIAAIFPTKDRFVDRTGAGPATLRELRELLRADRERGWSIEHGSTTENVTCIAAAAVDNAGLPVLSVGVSFFSDRVPQEDYSGIAAELTGAAARLSRRFGGLRGVGT